MTRSNKQQIINIIIALAGLLIVTSVMIYINKITTPNILESDLFNQCRNAGGKYNAYQWDGSDNIRVYCEMPTKYLFDIKLK